MSGWIAAAVLAVLVLATLGFWMGHFVAGSSAMYYYRGGFFPFGFFPFGFLFFAFVVFMLVRLLFWRGAWGWGYWGHRGYWGDARDIVKRRYAKGEITKDQFEQMLRDLEQH